MLHRSWVLYCTIFASLFWILNTNDESFVHYVADKMHKGWFCLITRVFNCCCDCVRSALFKNDLSVRSEWYVVISELDIVKYALDCIKMCGASLVKQLNKLLKTFAEVNSMSKWNRPITKRHAISLVTDLKTLNSNFNTRSQVFMNVLQC